MPILHFVTITLNTTIEDDTFQFIIPFAVADINCYIRGTHFFEEDIQNLNIQHFTLKNKYQSPAHPNFTKFTSLWSKDSPYFSFIYRINLTTQKQLKPNFSKIAQFPVKHYYNLNFTTTPQNQFFLQFHTLLFPLNLVQHSILLKFSQAIN